MLPSRTEIRILIFFLDVFEELYHLEAGYKNGTSSSEQILVKTKEIII
jgi:hypothetical protein